MDCAIPFSDMAAKSKQCQLGDIMAEVTMYLPKSGLIEKISLA